MKVPQDKYQCTSCGHRPSFLACEACWETICYDCLEGVWVVRNGEEVCHALCKGCANVEP